MKMKEIGLGGAHILGTPGSTTANIRKLTKSKFQFGWRQPVEAIFDQL